MGFQLSPGTNVSEIDLTTIVPSVATSIGAFAGLFNWGPVDQVVSVPDEITLAAKFGKPDNSNYEYWFSAANFLAYSNNLKTIRTSNLASTLSATGDRLSISSLTINNAGTGYSNSNILLTSGLASGVAANVNITVNGSGSITSLNIVNPSGNGMYDYPPVFTLPNGANAVVVIHTVDATSSPVLIKNDAQWESNFSSGNSQYGLFAARYPGAIGNSLLVSMADYASFNTWTYNLNFPSAPGTSSFVSNNGGSNDELHIIVIDQDGKFTGVMGTVLETYPFVSKASDAKDDSGNTNYYKNVIAAKSKYINWMSHPVNQGNVAWGSASSLGAFGSLGGAVVTSLSGGADGNISTANVVNSLDQFYNAETIDISLIVTGPGSLPIVDEAINIATSRMDSVVFISPPKAAVVDNYGSEVDDITTFRNTLTSTSYAVMDSGWKYQYDKYSDVYRWVPLNGDIAGLCARTDRQRDPWFSPGGLNRGIIQNVIKLAWNPKKTDRDNLYVVGVNPVVTFNGEGTVLFGDKTLLSKPSAFDRINVRRLFIVLEKSIAIASKYSLFEFNDQFTRSQFVSMVEPFLRDVQGRRGITDFRVVCDETNNTGEVIDANQFVGDIYVKPARSINFVQLNFIAVRTGVEFSEIVGKF